MKIGILGTRGIPNAYGGFEQFAQYLAQGLVRKGHEVYVYNSSDHPYQDKEWKGIRILHCKDWESRIGTAGQFLYDYNCLRDARHRNFDVLLQLGYTSNSVWYWLWPRHSVNIVNMDGLEWKRSKYSPKVQRFLLTAEKWAARHGDVLIADSKGIQQYIHEKYKLPSVYIPYGAEIPSGYNPEPLQKYELEPNDYFLAIARMEPENNLEMVIKGWMASGKKKPLVLIGNTGNTYGQSLTKKYQDPGLRFIGAIYEPVVINTLRHYSYLYFHGHSVGGTNPSLLEAMACECLIAANDNIFNKAILGEQASYFGTPEEVTRLIDHTLPEEEAGKRKQANLRKIGEIYNWDRIIDEYENVFKKATGKIIE